MKLKERLKYRWEEIFMKVGISPSHFENPGKGRSCPVCLGHDRFTYYNKNGDGTAYCRGGCGIRGDGFNLVAAFVGLDPQNNFPKIYKLIEELIDG